MCGIAGLYYFDPSRRVDPVRVARMTDCLTHRGPDDSGFMVSGPVGLGHRRLSIIDLAGGRQPIDNEDGSVVIVFNGEVYNYADLTQDLLSRGHTFKTRSDTETMVHAYEEHGDDCVHQFQGMFAFAIWDRRRRRLLLARDRMGVKPLYYHVGEGFLAFASEIKALLELPEIPREPDPSALEAYLALRYVPGPGTMFKGIQKLQPGHRLIADEHGVRVERYWDLAFHEEQRSDAEHQERFADLFADSVRLRMIAEVPVGVFLSGGIDSSAVLAQMARLVKGHPVKSFAVGYRGAEEGLEADNEFGYARLAAQSLGAEHHEYHLTADQFRDFVPDLVYKLDEPLADPSTIPLYFLSRLAREHITVVLSGEGSDEILGGYGIYRRMRFLDAMQRRAPALAAALAPRLAAWAPNEVTRRYVRLLGLPLAQRYRGVSKGVAGELATRLRPDMPWPPPALDALFNRYYDAVRHASPLNRMLYVDTKVWLPDDLLLKADKMTMANALELRVPFLDYRLVELAATLPEHLKIQGRTGKVVLRRAMRGMIPDPILNRPKKGFPVPTRTWFRGPLAGFAREVLLASGSACRQHFETSAIESVLSEHTRGTAHWEQEIWTLMVFEYWHKTFLSRSRHQERHIELAPAAVGR
jgi:asparagine synthase (glutamine-hydrolysing)